MEGRLKRFLEGLNFTSTERIVVLTLAGAFVLGLGIRLFRDTGPGPADFDYSASDVEFSQKSAGPGGSSPAAAGAENDSMPGAGSSVSPRANGAPDARLDLNRATKRDLMGLPGVGEVLAERILLYREEHGEFGRVADLLKVSGIGKKKLEKLTPFCTVED
jgi:competence ComEA-like helix-hairpin-helix protein